jgi:DNA polymerase III subunit epsilon
MRWRITAGAAGHRRRADWRSAEYCAIDVETTGLDLRTDSVVSVGSVPIRDGRIIYHEHYYSLIRPASPVSVAAMRVHYLRPADLAHAPAAGEVAQQVASRLAGRIVVAHAAWVERAFLTRLLRQAGARFGTPVIDTAALARALGYAAGTRDGHEPSLELLARQLSLPVYAPHHALGDAVTTAAVFLALATRAAQAGGQARRPPVSARSLLTLSARHAY